MPRLAPFVVALAGLAALPSRAGATEIEPPPPLSGEIATTSASALVERWSGRDAENGAAFRDLARAPGAPAVLTRLIVDSGGHPALSLPFEGAAGLPPVPLESAGIARSLRPAPGGPLLVTSVGPFEGAVSVGDAPLSGTRFDVRPADRNPIALGGDALDELTARVVRTPEPGTLALFALGAAALAVAASRRRRR